MLSPYVAVYRIKTSLAQRDREELVKNMNISLLRSHLRTQLVAAMQVKISEPGEDALKTIPATLRSELATDIAETLLTGDGLRALMAGRKITIGRPADIKTKGRVLEKDLLPKARYAFENMTTFTVSIKTDSDADVSFILAREGLLSWKLINIIVPIHI